MRRFAFVATFLLALTMVAVPARAEDDAVPHPEEKFVRTLERAMSAPAREVMRIRDGLTRSATEGAAPASHATAGTTGASGDGPTITESMDGAFDPLFSPSDSTGAVGPTRYIQLVNDMVQIWDKTTSPPVLLNQSSLYDLVDQPSEFVFDPQIIWDATTARFYYVTDNIVTGGVSGAEPENYQLAWGYSLTDSPTTPEDWCHYNEDFGTYGLTGHFPDYPKLGDSEKFLLIGTNVFPHFSARHFRTDVAWIQKPPAVPACVPSELLNKGVTKDLRNENGTPAFTPVPAIEVDDAPAGYITATAFLYEPEGKPTDFLTVFQARNNRDGTVGLNQVGESFPVTGYDFPPPAPQPKTQFVIDTNDTRLTQAVFARDPARQECVIWTQHTVAGGGGSELRWYEIMAHGTSPGLVQSGVVSDPDRFVFGGSVSSDRVVTEDGTRKFGDSIVLGFSTASESTKPVMWTASKVPGQPLSDWVEVVRSPTPDRDFTCSRRDPCRWGDYASSVPDPAADLNAEHGVVWSTNMWVGPDPLGVFAGQWRTWIWAATP